MRERDVPRSGRQIPVTPKVDWLLNFFLSLTEGDREFLNAALDDQSGFVETLAKARRLAAPGAR